MRSVQSMLGSLLRVGLEGMPRVLTKLSAMVYRHAVVYRRACATCFGFNILSKQTPGPRTLIAFCIRRRHVAAARKRNCANKAGHVKKHKILEYCFSLIRLHFDNIYMFGGVLHTMCNNIYRDSSANNCRKYILPFILFYSADLAGLAAGWAAGHPVLFFHCADKVREKPGGLC